MCNTDELSIKVEWELFGSWDTRAKLQVSDNSSADLLMYTLSNILFFLSLLLIVQETAPVKFVHSWAFPFFRKMGLDRLDVSTASSFSPPQVFLPRNTTQETRFSSPEEAIRWYLLFKGKLKRIFSNYLGTSHRLPGLFFQDVPLFCKSHKSVKKTLVAI